MTISVDRTTLAEGDGGTTGIRFTITQNPAAVDPFSPLSPTTETWALSGTGTHPANAADFGAVGTPFPASSGSQYIASGSVTFSNGATSQDVVIPVAGDTTYEPDESFYLLGQSRSFVSVTGLPFAYSFPAFEDSPTVTIRNDDAQQVGQLALDGRHDQYVIAPTTGTQGTVQDTVAGRDGAQSLSGLTDLMFTDGTGVFTPSGSAEVVAHLIQAAFDRAPDLQGLSFWTGRIDGGLADPVTVANAFVTSPEFAQTYGDASNGDFVAQLYQNLLGRAADADGQRFWTAQLDAGTSRGAVLLGFSGSQEYVQKALGSSGDPNYGEAYRIYRAALGRTPDAAGLDHWVTALQQGTTPQQVADSFAASAEFVARTAGLDNNGYVAALYQNVLGRAGDDAGQQFWAEQLRTSSSRAAVLLGFADSAENRAATAAATHDGWVFLPGQG